MELDLERLYHHRAQTAPRDAPAASLLVRWSAASAELARVLSTPVTGLVTDLRRTAKQERVEAARCLLAFLERAGGAVAAAANGASPFRQAVLLFRPPATTRQVPAQFSQSAPVPGSRLGDRNSGTARPAHPRVAHPPWRRPHARRRASQRPGDVPVPPPPGPRRHPAPRRGRCRHRRRRSAPGARRRAPPRDALPAVPRSPPRCLARPQAALRGLADRGLITKTEHGWTLAAPTG